MKALLFVGILGFTGTWSSLLPAQTAIRCNRVLSSQYQAWRQAWHSTTSENPKNNTPFFAIGIHDELRGFPDYFRDGFLDQMTLRTGRLVFNIVASGSGIDKYREEGVAISFETLEVVGDLAMSSMLFIPGALNRRSPETKNVLVNLNGIDLSHPNSPTTIELLHLFQNPDLLAHSRWFLKGQELSFDEIYNVYARFKFAFRHRLK